MRHAACEGLADGGFEFGGAITIEQPQQRGRDRSKIVAAAAALMSKSWLAGAAMVRRSVPR
jgi:hypothetical protein